MKGEGMPFHSIAPLAAYSFELSVYWNGKDLCLLKLLEQNSCQFQSVAYLEIWNHKRDTRWTHEWAYITGMSVELHIWAIDCVAAFILKKFISLSLSLSYSLSLSLSTSCSLSVFWYEELTFWIIFKFKRKSTDNSLTVWHLFLEQTSWTSSDISTWSWYPIF